MKGRLHSFRNANPGGPPRIETTEAGRFSVGIYDEEKGHAKSLDYFRIYSGSAEVRALWKKIYGDKPTEIKVSFLDSDPARVCNHSLVLRPGKRYAWGDGETFTYYDRGSRKNKTVEVKSEEEQSELMTRLELEANDYLKASRELKVKEGKQGARLYDPKRDYVAWEESLTLRLWLYELGLSQEFIFSTKGKETSIPSIVGVFDTVRYAAKTVQLLPFTLRVRQHNSDNMVVAKYPIVELVPPSANMIGAVGDLGRTLYESYFGGGGRMTVLEEEKALATAEKLRLNPGTGINTLEVRPEDEIDPDPELLEMADKFFANIEAMPKEIVEAGGLSTLDVGARVPTANPGSLAFAIQSIVLASTWASAVESWNENQEQHGGSQAYRKAALLRLVSLTQTKKQLDDLVRDWKDFHSDEDFKAAVVARRDKNGWKKE